MMSDATEKHAEPVTVVIHHRVRAGREAAFEDWLRGITSVMLKFPGHAGFHVIRPANPAQADYLVLHRFDSLEHLERWERSDERKVWLDRLSAHTVAEPTRARHTGMEVWFTAPAGRPTPRRYRMVAVTVLALYPLVSVVQVFVVPHLSDWPVLLRTLVTTVLMVLAMTYVLMPSMTRLFGRWLYGPNDG